MKAQYFTSAHVWRIEGGVLTSKNGIRWRSSIEKTFHENTQLAFYMQLMTKPELTKPNRTPKENRNAVKFENWIKMNPRILTPA